MYQVGETVINECYKLEIINDDSFYLNEYLTEQDYFDVRFYHKKYDFGTKKSLEETEKDIESGNYEVFKVYMYDHSGLSFSISDNSYPFNCQWDSGVIGYILVDKDHEFENINNSVKCFIDTINDICSGNVYGYNLYLLGEIEASCWGFIGDSGLEAISNDVEHFIKLSHINKISYPSFCLGIPSKLFSVK